MTLGYSDEYKKELIAKAELDFINGDDGYWHYWPTGHGYLTACQLRIIADELDKRNEPWHNSMEEYFKNQRDKQS